MLSMPKLLKIDRTRWTSKVRTPVVLADWIFFVQVNFEEPVVHSALEVLIPNWNVTFLRLMLDKEYRIATHELTF